MLHFSRPHSLWTEHRLLGNQEQPNLNAGPNPETAPRAPSLAETRANRLAAIQRRLQGVQQAPEGPQALQTQLDRRQARTPNGLALNGMNQRQQMLGQQLQRPLTLPGSSPDLAARQRRDAAARLRYPNAPTLMGGIPGNTETPTFSPTSVPANGPRPRVRPGQGPANSPQNALQARRTAAEQRYQNPSALTLNRVGPLVQSELALRPNGPQPRPGVSSRAPVNPGPALRQPENVGSDRDWLSRLNARTDQALSIRNLTLPDANSRIERDPSGMANFDLPRNEPIGYIGLYDAVDSWEAEHLNAFPGLMNRAGYRFVTNGPAAMSADRDPIGMLRQRIQQLEAQGVRYAYINLVPHGSPRGMMVFQTPSGQRIEVSPNAVTALTREFRTMRFYFNVNSCYGGGFDAADFSDPGVTDLTQRVTVVTQSDRFTPTPVMMLPGRPERGVTYYDAILTQYLQRGVPYGRAHCLAEQTVRQIFPSRPGVTTTVYRSGRSRPSAA